MNTVEVLYLVLVLFCFHKLIIFLKHKPTDIIVEKYEPYYYLDNHNRTKLKNDLDNILKEFGESTKIKQYDNNLINLKDYRNEIPSQK